MGLEHGVCPQWSAGLDLEVSGKIKYSPLVSSH